MLSAIRTQGLTNSTAVIITAKHGESPLTSTRTIVDQTLIGRILANAGIPVPATPTPLSAKTTQKTSELIWLPRQVSNGVGVPPVALTTPQVRAETTTAVTALSTSTDPGFQPSWTSILSFGPGWPFPDPTIDPATPDIVVVMKDGVNFEPQPLPSPPTNAEHGGFGENETHVPLLVSYPAWAQVAVGGTVTVSTRQIAPTVLSMLGLNPAALDAVRIEGIGSLSEVITRLDTNPPVIVPTVTPSPNLNGWNNSDVSVS
jgi:arylsulfatase A-like enzyme